MKKQILSIAILILVSACAGSAQTVEQQVAKIRAVYTETNRRISAGAKDNTQGFHNAEWTIGGERDGQLWDTVGTMKIHAECWFDGEPDPETENEVAKQEEQRKSIRKIVWTHAAADDIRSREEY